MDQTWRSEMSFEVMPQPVPEADFSYGDEPMVTVLVRRFRGERGEVFTRWPVAKLQDVIKIVGDWGIRDESTGKVYDEADLTGEFVLRTGSVIFEITIDAGTDEEASA
jgi:hypothetical protein